MEKKNNRPQLTPQQFLQLVKKKGYAYCDGKSFKKLVQWKREQKSNGSNTNVNDE